MPAAFAVGSNAPVEPSTVPPLFTVYTSVPPLDVPVVVTVTASLLFPLSHTVGLLTVTVGVGRASTFMSIVTSSALQPFELSKLYVTVCVPAVKLLGTKVAVVSLAFVATVHVPVPVTPDGVSAAVIVCDAFSLIQCSSSGVESVADGFGLTVIEAVPVPSQPLASVTFTSTV